MSTDNPGWDQYSILVIQQLENLSTSIEALRNELQDVKNQLTELKAKEDRVQDIKFWKEKLDEVASPSQLKTVLEEVEELKLFKNKAVTIFAMVKFIIGSAIALMGYL